MTIKLSSFGGSGGGFTVKFASAGVLVPAGATGTYVIMTPPAGQKVKLCGLSSATTQTNSTTVSIGGVDILTGAKLLQQNDNSMSSGQFKAGDGLNNELIGGVNEAIEIKTDVATSSGTYYYYQFGV